MIKIRHKFHENTSISGNGIDYEVGNKSTNSIIAVSCGGPEGNATSATLTFYGKSLGSEEFIAIKALKSSDYSLQSTGSINESYLIDLTSYTKIRVALSNVQGGNVTVIGEVIE